MRPTPWLLAEQYRMPDVPMWESAYGDGFGCFDVPFTRTGVRLKVIATDGDHLAAGLGPEFAWEHVSVSLPNRCPNWPEMDFIKGLFWGDDETVMQLHVPRSDHRNLHPNCLHLWRPVLAEIPRPPNETAA